MLKIRKYALPLLLSLFALCLPAAGYCADTTTAQPTQTVQMSLEQYNQLKMIINGQEIALEQLQSKLDRLDSNSTVLQTQLTQAKEQLTKTKQSLTTADSSLSQANEALKQQSQSLETLTEQIKSAEHKQAVVKRQRDMWASAAGILLVGCIVK